MSKIEPKKLKKFGESFKKEKVKMLENGEITPTELRRLYKISYSTVYRWKEKYGTLPPNEKVVIEKESDMYKTGQLLKRIKEMEAMIGRLSMETNYLKGVIKSANELYDTDIEKKFALK